MHGSLYLIVLVQFLFPCFNEANAVGEACGPSRWGNPGIGSCGTLARCHGLGGSNEVNLCPGDNTNVCCFTPAKRCTGGISGKFGTCGTPGMCGLLGATQELSDNCGQTPGGTASSLKNYCCIYPSAPQPTPKPTQPIATSPPSTIDGITVEPTTQQGGDTTEPSTGDDVNNGADQSLVIVLGVIAALLSAGGLAFVTFRRSGSENSEFESQYEGSKMKRIETAVDELLTLKPTPSLPLAAVVGSGGKSSNTIYVNPEKHDSLESTRIRFSVLSVQRGKSIWESAARSIRVPFFIRPPTVNKPPGVLEAQKANAKYRAQHTPNAPQYQMKLPTIGKKKHHQVSQFSSENPVFLLKPEPSTLGDVVDRSRTISV